MHEWASFVEGKIGVYKSVHMWIRSQNDWFGVKSVGKSGWVYVLQGLSCAIPGFYVAEFCCL